MASRGAGPIPSGTDGQDYMHRQRVAEQYFTSLLKFFVKANKPAQCKSRLKFCIFYHFVLFFLMVAKLSPDILDKLDIFILEIEELEIPKPLLWEYVWCCSILVSVFALSAMKRNNISFMKRYMYLVVIFGLGPVVYGAAYYFKDIWQYVGTRSTENIQMWGGYPYGLLWYAFIGLAVQVHTFSIYFSNKLLDAWLARGMKKSR